MKLGFEKGTISRTVAEELDFSGYLSLFDSDLPLLPDRVLQSLGTDDLKSEFARLKRLEEQLLHHRVDLNLLLEQSRKIPAIDHLLGFFEDVRLEAYHLFDLGIFLQTSDQLQNSESSFPISNHTHLCSSLLKIVSAFTEKDFKTLKLSREETDLRHSIQQINRQIEKELSLLEQQVLKETGLKLVYSLPRELNLNNPQIASIKKCTSLKKTLVADSYRIELIPTKTVQDLKKNSKHLQASFQQSIEKKMDALNAELLPYFQQFKEYYVARKKRVWDYHLISCKKKYQLCFPLFTDEFEIKMEKGRLPALEKRSGERYQPLQLELKSGINLLFGGNMTGKTTVLKTLYFHLNLVKLGLPVPAKNLTLGIPNQIRLLLKSSGEIGTGLSGFGDEIQFFCHQDKSPSVYLIDELFHSTDPINGVKLTKAFLEGLIETQSLYLCTSHYTEAIGIAGISVYRMKDIEQKNDQAGLEEILTNVPYEIEAVDTKSLNPDQITTNQPLKIALRFPIPESIKHLLEKSLDD